MVFANVSVKVPPMKSDSARIATVAAQLFQFPMLTTSSHAPTLLPKRTKTPAPKNDSVTTANLPSLPLAVLTETSLDANVNVRMVGARMPLVFAPSRKILMVNVPTLLFLVANAPRLNQTVVAVTVSGTPRLALVSVLVKAQTRLTDGAATNPLENVPTRRSPLVLLVLSLAPRKPLSKKILQPVKPLLLVDSAPCLLLSLLISWL